MMDTTTIEIMASKVVDLKAQEERIKQERTYLENKLAEIIATKYEGTDTKNVGQYKITVATKLTRTLDYPAYLAIINDIPEGVRCVRMKPELDLKKLRAMEMVRPGFSAQFITSKPAKPSVKVEVAS